jgi:hydroxymethylpyrimidine pyrophosphatase-like HAD family hydrolase
MSDTHSALQPGPRYTSEIGVIEGVWFDIDNTVVPNESAELPTPEFIDAAHSAGKVALLGVATARPPQKALHIIEAAGMNAPCILSNGAQIYDPFTGKMLVERVLDDESTEEIAHRLQGLGIAHWVQDGGRDYLWSGRLTGQGGGLGEYVVSKNIWVPPTNGDVEIIDEYEPKRPFVIVAHNVPAAELETMRALGAGFGSRGMTSLVAHENHKPDGSKTYEVFFLHPKANKRDALDFVADHVGIPLKQMAAVGDGPNDKVIVEHAGVGVALDNAVQETKAVATFIAPSRENNGAAVALRELVLNSRAAGTL